MKELTLEQKRTKLELLRVSAARAEMEFKIEERLSEIERIKEHIEIQLKREAELKEQISKFQVGE